MVKARDQDIRFLKSFANSIKADLHVAQLGRVYKTNEDNSLVDVQPLVIKNSLLEVKECMTLMMQWLVR